MKYLISYIVLAAGLWCSSCGCDSQAPGDMEEQFDADTINAPEPDDSTLMEQNTPMNTDSSKAGTP